MLRVAPSCRDAGEFWETGIVWIYLVCKDAVAAGVVAWKIWNADSVRFGVFGGGNEMAAQQSPGKPVFVSAWP